jgi:hypothetical protein
MSDIDNDLIKFIQYDVDDTHFHIAQLLYKMYKGKFRATLKGRSMEWSELDDKTNTWKYSYQGICLRKKLSTEVVDLIVRARLQLKKQGEEEYENVKKQREEDAKKKNVTQNTDSKRSDFSAWFSEKLEGARYDTLLKIDKKLYQEGSKSTIMRAAMEQFHE